MEFLSFARYPLWINGAAFGIAAALVWGAGTRLSRYLNAIAEQTGIGKAFTGMLLLGGITSLPEVATVATACHSGNVALATNNLLGSIAINVLLLALADSVLGRHALTSVVASPAALLQGTLNVLVLALAAAAVIAGDILVLGVGAWSAGLLLFVIAGMWLVSRYKHRRPWQAVGRDLADVQQDLLEESERDGDDTEVHHLSLGSLIGRTTLAAAVILVAGFVLATSGDAIAAKTGLGSTLVGFLLVGFATSLPEISSIVAAMRAGEYEMALGDIFGTNLFNVALIFLADLVYRGSTPVLDLAGRFESFALMLGIALTGIYLLGLLERENKTILRMGYDSLAVILTFAGGVAVLYMIRNG